MVEYAGLTAALAVLLTSLGGLAESIESLPLTNAKAIEAVTAGAKRERVAPRSARRAYRHAPYRKPALKYLYAVGWVGATAHAASCRAGILLGSPRRDALRAIEASAEVRARLRKAKIPRTVAADVVARGIADACT